MKKLFSLIIILLTYNLYSGVSFTYSNGESLKHQRHLHQSQKLKDGRIIVFGGFNGYFGAPKYYSSTEIYYPEFDRWFEGPNMNTYRYNHSSSVLGDGRVITVGGSFNNSSEIFDPQTNEWKYINAPIGIASNTKLITLHDGRALIAGNGEEGRTKCNLFTPMDEKWIEGPSLNQNHGEGFSLTVLSSGKVIIIGGSTAQNSIEIYDPIKNSWTEIKNQTIYKRYNHSAIELQDGNLLITGGSDLNESKYTEIFDILKKSSSSQNIEMPVPTSYSPMFLLDNGKPVIFTIGDLFSLNRKSFQEFNTNTNSWEYSNNNEIGTSGYTVHRLNNGNFLIIGGNATSGNGASSKTFIVTQENSALCNTPDLTNKIETISKCYGKEGLIKISESQSGVKYSLWTNLNKFSDDYNGNGDTLEIPVLSSKLTEGKSEFLIGVKKTGCPNKKLNNTASFNFTVTVNETPIINFVSGDTISCEPKKVLVSAQAPAHNVLWHDESIGHSSSFEIFTDITARYEFNGCLSKKSNTIRTRKIQGSDFDLNKNPNEICSNDTIDLEGFPKGGYWSGNGVFNDSKFTAPYRASVVSPKYNFCNTYAEKRIYIQEANSIKFDFDNNLYVYPDPSIELCGYQKRTVHLDDFPLEKDKYSVYFNDSLVKQTKLNYDDIKVIVNNDSSGIIKVVIESEFNENNNLCEIDSFVKEFRAPALKRPKTNYEIIYPKEYCYGDTAKIYLVNPDTNAFFSSYKAEIIDYKTDTITFGLKTNSWSNFEISVSNSENCKYKIRLKDENISIRHLNLKINTPTTIKKGDTLKLRNSSMADYYTWNFNNDDINKKEFDTILNELGTYEVRLIGYLDEGCSDTTYSTVHVFDERADNNIQPCFWDTINRSIPNLENQKIHIDGKGNKYIYGSAFASKNGADYSGSYAWVIAKFDENWNLLWTNRLDTSKSAQDSDFYSAFINGIDTDEEGNVYIAGSIATEDLQFEKFNIKRNVYKIFNGPIMGKINSNGLFEWFYYNELPYENEARFATKSVGTDVVYNNGKVYFNITGLGEGHYRNVDGDTLAIPLHYDNGWLNRPYNGIVVLDSLGNYIKTHKTSSYFGPCRFLNPSRSSIVINRVQYDSPKLELKDNDKLIIKGCIAGYGSVEINKEIIPSNYYENGPLNYEITLNLSDNEFDPGIKVFEDIPSGQIISGNDQISYQYSNFNAGKVESVFKTSDGDVMDFSRKASNTFSCVISSINNDHTYNWKKEIYGFSAQKISFDERNERILMSGTYRSGFYYEGYGLEPNERDDLIIIVLDTDANLLFTENISSKNDITSTDHLINQCGDIIVSMEAYNLVLKNDSLNNTELKTVILEIPFRSKKCNSKCNLVTKLKDKRKSNNFQLYPNPAKNMLFLIENNEKIISCEISDTKGRIIISNLNPKKGMDISSLSQGLYVLRIVDNLKNVDIIKFQKIK